MQIKRTVERDDAGFHRQRLAFKTTESSLILNNHFNNLRWAFLPSYSYLKFQNEVMPWILKCQVAMDHYTLTLEMIHIDGQARTIALATAWCERRNLKKGWLWLNQTSLVLALCSCPQHYFEMKWTKYHFTAWNTNTHHQNCQLTYLLSQQHSQGRFWGSKPLPPHSSSDGLANIWTR